MPGDPTSVNVIEMKKPRGIKSVNVWSFEMKLPCDPGKPSSVCVVEVKKVEKVQNEEGGEGAQSRSHMVRNPLLAVEVKRMAS